MDHEKLLKDSLSHLAKVFSPEEFVIPSEGYPLMQACAIIGQAMNLNFKMPPTHSQDIEGICSASRIRYRQISLKKNWWQESHGHFLAFKKGQPVAVIQFPAGYQIINPETEERIPVDSTTGQQLDSQAYTFYESLQETPLTFTKILELCTRGTRRDYLTLMLVGFLATAISFFFPVANKVLFDYVIPNFNINLYVQVVIGLILATCSSAFFFFTRSVLMLRLDGIFENRLQMSLWDRLLKLPVQFFRSLATGDLIQRTLIVDVIRTKLSDNTLRVFLNSFFGLAYFLMMLLYSWQLALIGLFFAILNAAISSSIFFFVLHNQRKLLASNATINAFLTQVVEAISKIRIAVAEHRMFAHWAREFAHNQRLNLKTQNLQNVAKTTSTVIDFLSKLAIFSAIILILTYEETNPGVQKTLQHLSLGSFIAFFSAFLPFMNAVSDLATTLVNSVEIVPFWERARPIFTSPIESSAEKVDPGVLQGSVKVENLSFRYDKNSAFIINDFSLHVEPGEFIAIVGPSGFGKSTLCRLLIGFETPEKGMILYDQKDLQGLDIYKVREQIGTVLQNSAIFQGTIRDNLTCGKHFTPEQLQKALELSTFNEDLAQLPMKLETILPTGGNVLSGGQKQRLILARALLREPKILILDEATSSLDNATQEKISRNIEGLKVTRIVIAHRRSTIKNANRVYTMKTI